MSLPAKATGEPSEETAERLRLVVIVTFQDEAWCLPRFLASMAAQTRQPDRLVLLDDGSSDRSFEIAGAFARLHSDVEVLRRPQRAPVADRLADAAEYRAFLWAVARLEEPWDVVAKMDADLQLSDRTVEAIMTAFKSTPELGMAGAVLSEIDSAGRPVRLQSPADHVEGATKFYRRPCWASISPVEPVLGWDSADEITARSAGWSTLSIRIPDGDPIHLRTMGTHGPILRSFRRWGACAWGYGAHPMHVALYAGILMIRRPPRLIGGINFVAGWAQAGLQDAPRATAAVREATRAEQLSRIRRRFAAVLTMRS
jgi:glycosyltransferase involved in cell wall biosynthesis